MSQATKVDHPPSQRRANVSARIEEAGLRLFIEHGIDSVTVEAIASAAGISRRTFYRYFDAADAILTAYPMRALRRLSHDIRARPANETLRQAFLNATTEVEPPESQEMLPLLAKIARKSPAAFDRAMARMKPITHEFFMGMVEYRLHLMGEDESRAGLVAAVLIATIEHTAPDFIATNRFHTDQTFDYLAKILGS